jgi:hypothetical protein
MIGSRLVIALMALATALAAANQPEPGRPPAPAVADSFPHARHGRLFTSCEACHAGLMSGDSASLYPSPEVCAPCHDGAVARRVDWAPGARRPSNLTFSHSTHPEIPCASCHSATDTASFMEVSRALPDRCLPCHAPEAESHLAQATCERCHRPLAEVTALPASRVARFPKPPSHDSLWVFAHPRQAAGPTCATCHAREFCASCHVNASGVAAIRALATDPRVAQLARQRRVVYRAPGTHRDAAFLRAHGLMARSNVAGCANCHTRESCLSCHREQERVAPVAQLPRRERGGARGVELGALRPPDHAPDFATRHPTAAAGGDASCARCHSPSFCATCHAGAAAPGFHASNFVERHSEQAYTGDNDCGACHQQESFCVACHRVTGRAATRAPVGRFHDAQPMWLFGHGGIARRAIESCAGCHEQRFCLTCHSASGGWRVNPHGPGFDPSVERRNPAVCRSCHAGGPPRG